MKNWKLIVVAILLVLLLVVISQNFDPVKTKFLLWSMTLPQAALLALTGLIGFVIGLLVALRMAGSRSPVEKGTR